MTATEIFFSNIEAIVLGILFLGGLYSQTKYQAKRNDEKFGDISEQFNKIGVRFDKLDEKDVIHDDRLSELDKRSAVNQARIDSQEIITDNLRQKIDKSLSSMHDKIDKSLSSIQEKIDKLFELLVKK